MPLHDRGRVLADAAVVIADGGRVLSDLAILRDQAELFGPVASDPTLWRVLNEIGAAQRHRIARARANTREHVWSLIAQRHGQIPPSRVADRDLGTTIVIRMDASLVTTLTRTKNWRQVPTRVPGGIIRWGPGATTPANRWR